MRSNVFMTGDALKKQLTIFVLGLSIGMAAHQVQAADASPTGGRLAQGYGAKSAGGTGAAQLGCGGVALALETTDEGIGASNALDAMVKACEQMAVAPQACAMCEPAKP